jgi:flagellar biosynthesis protein FlhF
MGFRRYLAPSAREAMERIRRELGPDAVVLSNRRTDSNRVEIIAAASGQMQALVEEIAPAAPEPVMHRPPRRTGVATRGPAPSAVAPHPAPSGALPAESFQEFVRRQGATPPRHAALGMYDDIAGTGRVAPAPASPPVSAAVPAMAVFRRRAQGAGTAQEPDRPAGAAIPEDPLRAELKELRSNLTARLTQLESRLAEPPAATAAARQATTVPPAMAGARGAPDSARRVLTRLLSAGFSADLARRMAQELPAGQQSEQVADWLHTRLAGELNCPPQEENVLAAPGAMVLVGPTGVGKTTTAAKLAARCIVRHGANALGLITVDAYRMGAFEQLRDYGRILGVPVQSAHDAAALDALLKAMAGKRQVIIDTCGLSQRDPRLADLLRTLDEARFAGLPLRRTLLLNSASHAETLDEVARAWDLAGCAGVILTKLDEAARIGGALDTVLRYRACILGLTNGQRVPEDWHAGSAALLTHLALKPVASAFAIEGEDAVAPSPQGAHHG